MEGNFRQPEGGWPQDDEAYWTALLEQGEVADYSPSPPAEVEEEPVAATTDQPAEETEMPEDPNGEDWGAAQEAMEKGEPLCLPVVGHNRGGLLVQCGSLQGFVPASLLADFPRDLSPAGRMEELARREGQELSLYVIEADKGQQRLVLSERKPQAQDSDSDAFAKLSVGMVCKGQVTNVCVFGAFVDLGGIEGLVHISEISWGRVHHPGDLLHPGQEVEVSVLTVDAEQQRVALSIKRLHEDPWATMEERYHVGQLVQGTVTNVVDFGAFVKVEEGLEGLIHVSELAEGDSPHPHNVLKEGDVVAMRILHIDASHHRLGLSLRQAAPGEAETPQGEGDEQK